MDAGDGLMDERSIDKLVARAVDGDTRAFGRLYDLYADRVHAYVRARAGDGPDAEDLTVTVFLKAYEAIGAYDRRGVPFGAWLFRIAHNAVVDWARSKRRSPEVVDLADAGMEQSPDMPVDDEVLRQAEAGRVRECVRRLPDDQAEVVTLRFLWELSLKETASLMERSEGAVKALQHRALRNLSVMLTEGTERA